MDWIDKLNQELEERRKKNSTLEAIEESKKRMHSWAGSLSRPSEEARKKLSEMKRNQNFTKEHRESLKKSKLKYKITKKQILDAQSKHQFAKDVAKELGITFNTYKSIATHHGVYKSLGENNMGRINGMKTATPIKVWKWNKETKTIGEFIGEFESVNSANKILGTTGNGLRFVANGTYKQAKGYYAEWIKK